MQINVVEYNDLILKGYIPSEFKNPSAEYLQTVKKIFQETFDYNGWSNVITVEKDGEVYINFYAVKNGLVGNDSTGVPAAFGRLERVLYPSYWETGLNQKSGEIELNILE
jgi:hypothetical protein